MVISNEAGNLLGAQFFRIRDPALASFRSESEIHQTILRTLSDGNDFDPILVFQMFLGILVIAMNAGFSSITGIDELKSRCMGTEPGYFSLILQIGSENDSEKSSDK